MTLNKVFGKIDEKFEKKNFLLWNEFRLNDFRWFQRELNAPQHFRLQLSNKLNDYPLLTIENPPTKELEKVFDRPNETTEEFVDETSKRSKKHLLVYFAFVDVNSFWTLFSEILILMRPSEEQKPKEKKRF